MEENGADDRIMINITDVENGYTGGGGGLDNSGERIEGAEAIDHRTLSFTRAYQPHQHREKVRNYNYK